MRTRLLGLMLVVLLTAAACGVSAESDPRALPAGVASATAAPSPVATDAGATRYYSLWFVEEDKLVQAERRSDRALTADAKLQSLAAGPTAAEADDGMRTAVVSVDPEVPLMQTADAAAVPVVPVRGEIPVVLSDEFAKLPGAEQLLALGQAVTTLTQGTGLQVLFVDSSGVAVAVPLPDGRLANRPVNAKDYEPLQP